MELFDIFSVIVGSPLFKAAAVLTAVAASGYAVLQAVGSRRRLLGFMETHGFRWTDTGSTLWLARVVERWDVLDICGHLDGRWVDVRSRIRRGRFITVTADRELVPGEGDRRVSLGPWTRPKPGRSWSGWRRPRHRASRHRASRPRFDIGIRRSILRRSRRRGCGSLRGAAHGLCRERD